MASGGVGSLHPKDHEAEWPSTIASLTVGAAFFALWFWLLPSWLGFRRMLCGRRLGGGSRPRLRYLGSRWLCVASGILDGRDTERLHPLPRQRSWSS